ncbi:hypothetical protein B566_EDAN006891 [Ephemera danica]|nr:hypothetical protein B566_EDAN006891 [Ephemera danica]
MHTGITMSRSYLLQRWYNIIRFHGGRSASCCCTRRASSGPLERQSNMYAPLTSSMSTISKSGSPPLSYVWPSRNVLLRRDVLYPVRFMSSVSDSDSDDEFDIVLHEREIKDPAEVFRSSLYPNSEDPLILKLNESKSVQDVFIFLHKNQDSLTSSHISQAVLVLWDLQRVFMQVSVDNNPIDNLSELQKYVKAVSGHPDFHNLLRLVKEKHNDFSPDALTCTLLYLMKMDVDKTHPTVEVLLQQCERELLSFPITAISRFLVAVQGGQLWTIAITQTVVPLVLKQIAECEDAEQFRLLTICISNIHHYVTPNVMNMYKTRVKFLLDTGIIGSKTPRTVVKIIQFLDFPRWSMLNANLVVELMHTFSGQIAEQRPGDIITLHRVFQGQLEPVKILEEIQDYVLKLLEKQDASSLSIEMLACVVPFSSSTTREKIFEELLKTHIKSPSFPLTMPIVFKILRYLKTSSVDICNLFWGETLKFLRKSQQEDFRLLRICHKYMHFNNNLGGTYRHYEFEKQMLEWLTLLLDKVPGLCPSKLSRIAAFIIGYGQSTIPVPLMKKVEEMAPQFSILDCLNISRGLQIATELRSKYRGAYVVEQLVTISSILSACTRSHLASSKLTLSEVNMLMRTYINMKGNVERDNIQSEPSPMFGTFNDGANGTKKKILDYPYCKLPYLSVSFNIYHQP